MTDQKSIEGRLRSRRRLLAGAAAATALLGMPAIVRAQGDRKIVTTGYGGIYEQHFKNFVIDPWEKRTGAKVEIYKTGGAKQWLTNAIVNKDKPEIDIPFLSLPLTQVMSHDVV